MFRGIRFNCFSGECVWCMWAGAKLSILVPVQLTASIPPIKQPETLYRFIHTLTRSLTQHVMNNNHTDCCCHCVCVCSRMWSAWSMHLGGAMTSSGWQAVRTVGVNQVRPDPLMVWTFIFKHFPVTCVRVTVQGADRFSSLVQMERQDVANPMWCAVRSWVVIWTFFCPEVALGQEPVDWMHQWTRGQHPWEVNCQVGRESQGPMLSNVFQMFSPFVFASVVAKVLPPNESPETACEPPKKKARWKMCLPSTLKSVLTCWIAGTCWASGVTLLKSCPAHGRWATPIRFVANLDTFMRSHWTVGCW